MTSPFRGLSEGMDTLIDVKRYNQQQERLDADRAAQKEMRDLQMSQLRRQEGEAATAAENLKVNRGLMAGMAQSGGYNERDQARVLENQANVMGDFGQASKLAEARKKLEDEGVSDTIRYARAGDFKKAVEAYNMKGDDKITSLAPDPEDNTGDTLIYTDPMGKAGKVKISQMESMLVDPEGAMKARAAADAKYADQQTKYAYDVNLEAIKSEAELERDAKKFAAEKELQGIKSSGLGARGGRRFISSGGRVFDTQENGYVPLDGDLSAGGLNEAQVRENEAIRNARIMVKNKRILRSDPRLDKNSNEFDPTLVDVVTLANRTYYGGDPAARAFAGGARSPEKVWGNKGLGMPQKPEERKPFQAKTMASDQLPDRAVAQLKPGANTAFANGQVWTIRDGQPVRVK